VNKALLSIPEIMRLILAECELEGGIRSWCGNRNLHPSIVDKFLSGQRGPAPQLLEALNLEKIVIYRQNSKPEELK
jgi:hypothetical protein